MQVISEARPLPRSPCLRYSRIVEQVVVVVTVTELGRQRCVLYEGTAGRQLRGVKMCYPNGQKSTEAENYPGSAGWRTDVLHTPERSDPFKLGTRADDLST